MKTIQLEKGQIGRSVEIRICTREELKNYINTHTTVGKSENADTIQTLYLWNSEEENEKGEGKDILFAVDNENKNYVVSSIMRVLFGNVINELLGEAEDGNILPELEIDHIAFDLADDLYKLLEEI